MDPYKVLGVSPSASAEEIKTVYKSLVKKYHPDKNAGDIYAEIIMKEINTAYDSVLNSLSKQHESKSSTEATVRRQGADSDHEEDAPHEHYQRNTCLDLVCCVDLSANMSEHIDRVKQQIKVIAYDIKKDRENKGGYIKTLRVRLIGFRDYLSEGKNAVLVTDFYELPSEEKNLFSVIDGIHVSGGSGQFKCGLEALVFAMKSKWNNDGDIKRHVIIVWTNGNTRKLGLNCDGYPKNMPGNFSALTEMWNGGIQNGGVMDDNAKRLIIYAPNVPYWSTISENWDNVIHFPSEAGIGIDELTYREIVSSLFSS